MEVVANAGDPGLSENTHFDILSRFIICQIKPTTRVASNKNPGAHLFFLIKRPRQLWIDADGSPAQQGAKNFVQTRRVDYTGNINVGVPGSFSINTIPLLNHDYAVGETIKCTKIKTEKAGHHHVFTSKFTNHIYSAFYGSQPFATENPHKFGGNAPYDKVPGNINSEMLYTNAYWDEYGPPKDLERVQNDMALYKQLKPLYPPNGLRKPPPALPADVRKRLNVIEKELAP